MIKNHRINYCPKRVRYISNVSMKLMLATLVLVAFSGIASATSLKISHLQVRNAKHGYQQNVHSTYVADENGYRVIIIASKSPKAYYNHPSSTNYNVNHKHVNTLNTSPAQLPGALALIEILRHLGIPGLPSPTQRGLGEEKISTATGGSDQPTLIDILRGVGVPGLPKPQLDDLNFRFGGGGIGRVDQVGGGGKGLVQGGEFGADLAGALVSGGFSRSKPSADKSNT